MAVIKSSKQSTTESFKSIKEGMSGVYRPLKTRFKHFNDICHGGINRRRIITIGGLSSFGKSHTLRQIEEDIFNEELNPGAKSEVILLKIDWEMTKEEAILNRVQARTGRNFEDIMFNEPDEEISKAFNAVYEEFMSDYIYEMFESCRPDNFYSVVKEFCLVHQDKRQIVVTIDNSNLIDADGSDEATALAKLQTNLIALKREISNISIIQLAQLNRDLKTRTSPKEQFPRTTDFYNSSKLEHASDVQIVVHNPYLLGCMEYGAVNYEKYSYLSEHLTKKNKHAVFKTKGLVFWHYVKVRAKNNMKDFKDLFIEKIYSIADDDQEVADGVDVTEISAPIFDTPEPPMFSQAILNNAGGEDF